LINIAIVAYSILM